MKPFKQAKILLALGIAAIVSLSSPADARSFQDESGYPSVFSYTYLQLGGGLLDTSEDLDGTVYEGRGSVALGDVFYLRGEGSQQEGDDDGDPTTTFLSGSLGVQTMLGERLGIYLDAGYMRNEAELGALKTTIDGPIVALGVRGISPEKAFEAELRYSYSWFDDLNDKTEDRNLLRSELVWRATENFGVYLGGSWEEASDDLTVSTYALGLRLSL